MTIVYKVLGQSNPAATTLTTLYTVPAATSTVISTVSICNQAATASSFSITVQPAGASILAKHYLNYNTPLPANDTITLTIGITLAATDIISVYAGSSTVSFSAFGSEIS
jgi:hypothetical protein